jgi:hypothetical protein
MSSHPSKVDSANGLMISRYTILTLSEAERPTDNVKKKFEDDDTGELRMSKQKSNPYLSEDSRPS